MLSATPFQKTTGGSRKNKCKWCQNPMEYILVDPEVVTSKFWFCPKCDNLPKDPA